jgi:hypothetical protein
MTEQFKALRSATLTDKRIRGKRGEQRWLVMETVWGTATGGTFVMLVETDTGEQQWWRGLRGDRSIEECDARVVFQLMMSRVMSGSEVSISDGAASQQHHDCIWHWP